MNSHGGLRNFIPGASKRAKKVSPKKTLTNMEDKSMIQFTIFGGEGQSKKATGNRTKLKAPDGLIHIINSFSYI